MTTHDGGETFPLRNLSSPNGYGTTAERIKKYISRINYVHFSQFSVKLEDMTIDLYNFIKEQEKCNEILTKILNDEDAKDCRERLRNQIDLESRRGGIRRPREF